MTLDILTSDLLAGARHGFFTRRGGASSGIYAGLELRPRLLRPARGGGAEPRPGGGRPRRRAGAAPLAPPGARHRGGHRRPGRLDRPPARRRRRHRRPRRRPQRPHRRLRAGPLPRPRRRGSSARPTPAGAARSTASSRRRSPPWSGSAPAGRIGARRRRPHHQPARLRGRPRVLRPLPRRGGRLRALLRPRPGRPPPLRPPRLRPRPPPRRRASPRRPGSAPAPTPTPTASSPTAAPPTPASRTTAGSSPRSASDRCPRLVARELRPSRGPSSITLVQILETSGPPRINDSICTLSPGIRACACVVHKVCIEQIAVNL